MKIDVYDDVLSDDLLKFILVELTKMTWNVHGTFSDNVGFFNCVTTDYLSHNFLLDLFNEKKLTETKELLRIYVNLYPPHAGGKPHEDDGDTTLLYLPDDWKEEWKGELLINEGKESIPYKKNRLIVFNAAIIHNANINLSNKNRHTIAWKTLT